MPAVIFADMEAEFIAYMKAALAARDEPHAAGVAVRQRVPDESGDAWPSSKRLVVVRDDGGPVLGDVRAVARLGVQVWAADEAETSDLANLVMALVGGWRSTSVRRVTPSRPYSVTEPNGRPSQYFTAELLIRGRGLPS